MFDSSRQFACQSVGHSRVAHIALAIALLIWLASHCVSRAVAQDPSAKPSEPHRNVLIELYVREGQPESIAALAAVNKVVASRPGLQIVERNISDNPDAQARLKAIADFFHFEAAQTPVVYACGRVIRASKSAEEFETLIDDMLKVEVFTQAGCPHCDTAHEYLNTFSKSYPGLEIIYRSISEDPAARNDMNNLSRELRTAVPETPVFHLCNQLMVGFDPAQFPGDHLRQILKKWTVDEVPATVRTNPPEPGS